MAASMPAPPPDFDSLSVDEQIDYVQSLWERIAANVNGVPVPDWHVQELDRRLGAPAGTRRPWSEIRAELVKKYALPE
jgi:putative addiction module component (TIGR02574 family)